MEYHYSSPFCMLFPLVCFVKIPWQCFGYSLASIQTCFSRPFFSFVVASLFSARFQWASKKPGLFHVDLNCSLVFLVELTPRPCWLRSWCSFSSILLYSFWFVFSLYTWPEAVSPTCLAITKFIESLSSFLLLTKVLNNLSELFEFK